MDTASFIALILSAFIIFGYVFVMVMRYRREAEEEKLVWGQRLVSIIGEQTQKNEDHSALLKEQKSVSGLESTFMSTMIRSEGFEIYLLRAGVTLSPYQFLLVCFGVGIAFFLLTYVLWAQALFSAVGALFASTVFPGIFLMIQVKRRKEKFVNEFPEALDMIRRGLRAGHTVEKAVEMVGQEVKGYVGEAFAQVVQKSKLGKPLEAALSEIANQVGVDEFRMLAIVIVLQRETGGSLAETVDSLAQMMRERQRIRRKLKMITAEGRITAVIITLLPFVVMSFILITNPNYMDSLFETDLGNKLLITAAVSLTLGVITIFHIVNKDPYR